MLKNNHNLDIDRLKVSRVMIERGPYMKNDLLQEQEVEDQEL